MNNYREYSLDLYSREDIINTIQRDFPSVDLSFIKSRDSISYRSYSSKELLSEDFFPIVESSGLQLSVFTLVGTSYIKFVSREIKGSPILVCLTNSTGDVKDYKMMGVCR